MTAQLPLLAERFLNTPLFLSAAKAEVIYSVLEGRISFTANTPPDAEIGQVVPEASRFAGSYQRASRHSSFVRAVGNAALITIDGSLVNRGAWLNSNSGLVSYEGIGAQIDDVARDDEIENVVLDINSSGGEATGMFGLAAKIRALRERKYVVAVVNDVAASAAYGIASSAHEIVISPTSVVGSVGVIMVHFDRSGELAQKGIRPTIIAIGGHKADGNPFGPLPEGVHASMLAHAQTFYDRFIESVEEGRGKRRLSAEKARNTEAGIFIGAEAISAGLADGIASLDEVLAKLKRPGATAGKPQNRRLFSMDPLTTTTPAATTDVPAPAAVAPAPVAAPAAPAPAAQPAAPAVAADPRERINAIRALPEAQGRMDIAMDFALNTEMSVEVAKATLAKLPTADAYQTIQQRAEGATEIGASGATALDQGAALATLGSIFKTR